MKFLVLGGAGFLGSHIVDALLQKGYSVRVFDLLNISTDNLEHCIDKIEIMGGDFSNADDIANAIEDVDIIVHLACTTLPGPSNKNPVYDVESNVIGTLKLLTVAIQTGVKKVIFISSGGTVYGIPQILPIPESHPTHPLCSYGISKLTIEKYLGLFDIMHRLDYTILRLGNPYGERQRVDSVQGAIAVFLGKVLKNETITIWGDGSVSRDYLYISDFISAFIRVVEAAAPSKIFNIASGKAYSLNEILSVIRDVTGKNPKVRFTPERELDVPVNCLDISKAKKELGWQPEVPLEEGIGKTWKWLVKNGHRG